MKQLLIISVFLLSTVFVRSQNLILNPGFEDRGGVSVGGTQISMTHVPYWTDPTAGSCDIYYYPSSSTVSYGYPKVDSGDCYCAFYGSERGKYWCEYLEGTFSKPLVKGTTYRFAVALAVYNKSGDGGMSVANEIGVTFSTTLRKNLAPLANGIHETPAFKLTDKQVIYRKDRWPVYWATYTAMGGEKYFIMGTYSEKGVEYENSYDKSTYFFGDNFSMTSNKPLGPIPDWVFEHDSDKTGFYIAPLHPLNVIGSEEFPSAPSANDLPAFANTPSPFSFRRRSIAG